MIKDNVNNVSLGREYLNSKERQEELGILEKLRQKQLRGEILSKEDQLLQKTVTERKVEPKYLFNANFLHVMKVDEFKSLQNTAIKTKNTYLTEVWVKEIESIIKLNLNNTGKGWFNLEESDKES